MKRFWRKLVVILTTPISFEWLSLWRRKPKAAEEIILVEPKAVSFETPLDTKKYLAGPRFVIERRRMVMKAGKIPGPTV